MRWAWGGVMTVLLFVAPVSGLPLSQAPVDPFYLKALSDGETLFVDGDYANAALSLEIAVFGLQNDRPNLEKALGYYALAAYRFGQAEKSREALRRLIALTGDDGLADIGLKEEARAELIKLAAPFKKTPSASDPPALGRAKDPARPHPGEKEKAEAGDLDRRRLADLEKMVKDEPGNVQAWLEIYDLQSRLKNARAAKRTLQRLVKEVPQEPRGHFLLGKTLYAEKKFKDALRRFDEAVSLGDAQEDKSGLALNSLGYGILTLNSMGRRDDVREKCRTFAERAPEGWLEALDMGDRDKTVLDNILAAFFLAEKDETESGTGGEKPRAEESSPAVEKKTEPGSPAQANAAARAYGMFDQYLQENNAAAARRTLERLLRQHPGEIRAVHLLAGLDYRQRKFEDARERFQAVIKEARQTGEREGLLVEAAAYLVLCARELRGHEAARALARAYRGDLEGAALDGLGLEGADKQLIRDYLAGFQDAEAPERTLERVEVQDDGAGLIIEIVCVPPTTYRAFVLERDRKIVIDLFNVTRILAERVVSVGQRGVQTLRTGLFQENTGRVVLDIEGDIPAYTIRETGTGLLVLVR